MSIDFEALKKLALECGFSHVGNLNADTIRVIPEVRAACAENKCGKYGKNWVCPPACGTLEECEKRLHSYKNGLILQSTAELEDEFACRPSRAGLSHICGSSARTISERSDPRGWRL